MGVAGSAGFCPGVVVWAWSAPLSWGPASSGGKGTDQVTERLSGPTPPAVFFSAALCTMASNSATVATGALGTRCTMRYPLAFRSASRPGRAFAVDGWMSWNRMMPLWLRASWPMTMR